jgi:hypothetical protein
VQRTFNAAAHREQQQEQGGGNTRNLPCADAAHNAERGSDPDRSRRRVKPLILPVAGYDPEFGARMLKRRIRLEVESELADSLLRGDVRSGDRVEIRWDAGEKAVRVKKLAKRESTGEEARKATETSA